MQNSQALILLSSPGICIVFQKNASLFIHLPLNYRDEYFKFFSFFKVQLKHFDYTRYQIFIGILNHDP